MENKVLVEIMVPMLDEVYNVFIPISKTVGKVTELLEKGIIELSPSTFLHNDRISLYDVRGKQIDPNLIIKDSEITNGSRLIIM